MLREPRGRADEILLVPQQSLGFGGRFSTPGSRQVVPGFELAAILSAPVFSIGLRRVAVAPIIRQLIDPTLITPSCPLS